MIAADSETIDRPPSPAASQCAAPTTVAATGPRVLLIQTQAENAGAQEVSRLVGAGLAARGYRVSNLFFFKQSASFDAPPDTRYCAPRRPGTPLSFLRFLWTLAREIRQSRPDAIMTFQHYGNAIGGGVARLVSPAPVIANQVSARAMIPRWLAPIDLLMGTLGLFRFITVNSQQMQREYQRSPKVYRDRLRYIAHGFDHKTTTLGKVAARRLFGLPQDGVLLGSVARLNRLKQLGAAIRLLPGRPDWQLALAGQGPDHIQLRQLAETLGVLDRVHFIGEISPDRIGDFLAALDVFVFPSLAETFGLAAVEAAHAGVPVVANDLPVLREVLSVEGKPAALFVDAADTERFAAAVATAIGDPATREALRRSALGLQSRYSIDAMVNEYVRLLELAMK